MYRYRVAGLTVSSDIEIPSAFPGPLGGITEDVTIRCGSVPERLEGAVAAGPIWAMAPGRFLLRVPGMVRFLLARGCTIVYEAEPAAGPGDVAAFLIGNAFGILLHQREQVVLHASSVAVNGKAVLFLGPSGAGKSTLAAALGQRGYPLVTDDFCVVDIDPVGTPMIHPDGRFPKLWAQSIERLNLVERRSRAVRGRLQKFFVEPQQQGGGEPLPIGAVYALREARAPYLPGIERPNVVDATLLLRENAFRPRLVGMMDQRARYFHLAAAVSAGAGIFLLTRDLNFAAMPEVISRLERHWTEAGTWAGAA